MLPVDEEAHPLVLYVLRVEESHANDAWIRHVLHAEGLGRLHHCEFLQKKDVRNRTYYGCTVYATEWYATGIFQDLMDQMHASPDGLTKMTFVHNHRTIFWNIKVFETTRQLLTQVLETESNAPQEKRNRSNVSAFEYYLLQHHRQLITEMEAIKQANTQLQLKCSYLQEALLETTLCAQPPPEPTCSSASNPHGWLSADAPLEEPTRSLESVHHEWISAGAPPAFESDDDDIPACFQPRTTVPKSRFSWSRDPTPVSVASPVPPYAQPFVAPVVSVASVASVASPGVDSVGSEQDDAAWVEALVSTSTSPVSSSAGPSPLACPSASACPSPPACPSPAFVPIASPLSRPSSTHLFRKKRVPREPLVLPVVDSFV
jgi:hypothetical protein